jgi:hypothetical protein
VFGILCYTSLDSGGGIFENWLVVHLRISGAGWIRTVGLRSVHSYILSVFINLSNCRNAAYTSGQKLVSNTKLLQFGAPIGSVFVTREGVCIPNSSSPSRNVSYEYY